MVFNGLAISLVDPIAYPVRNATNQPTNIELAARPVVVCVPTFSVGTAQPSVANAKNVSNVAKYAKKNFRINQDYF